MKFQVIYFSRSGNTKKVAEAIASELAVNSEDVKNAKLSESGIILLGTGNYGGKPGKAMKEFIDANSFESREVALFGTSGGGEGNEVREMESLLTSKGATIKETFYCKGQFLIFSRGHPSDEDLTEARIFAQDCVK